MEKDQWPLFKESGRPQNEQTLLVACKESNFDVLEQVVDKFALNEKYKNPFAHCINESFMDLRQLLHIAPCLILDFQVLIDRWEIYFILILTNVSMQ